jgi:ribonuclease HII
MQESIKHVLARSLPAFASRCADFADSLKSDSVMLTDVQTWATSREVIENNAPPQVCPKADSLYPIVSAASIVAKTSRDRQQATIAGNPGSGYPADPVTKAWLLASLQQYHGFSTDVRCVFCTMFVVNRVQSCAA